MTWAFVIENVLLALWIWLWFILLTLAWEAIVYIIKGGFHMTKVFKGPDPKPIRKPKGGKK